VDLPVAISFTVETDGSLPSGETIRDAIGAVDDATGAAASYFMINCAHPAHFDAVLEDEAAWTRRIRGVRANSSRKSHAELDESTELDAGDPVELAALYATLKERFGGLTVLGGCCGTDETHIQKIAAGVTAPQG
jgi:homocysteine S-methyltransferase